MTGTPMRLALAVNDDGAWRVLEMEDSGHMPRAVWAFGGECEVVMTGAREHRGYFDRIAAENSRRRGAA